MILILLNCFIFADLTAISTSHMICGIFRLKWVNGVNGLRALFLVSETIDSNNGVAKFLTMGGSSEL